MRSFIFFWLPCVITWTCAVAALLSTRAWRKYCKLCKKRDELQAVELALLAQHLKDELARLKTAKPEDTFAE